jgi:REP element-mobilizing transposase RayT
MRIAVAEVAQLIKSQSAKKLKAKFPFLHKTYASKESIWSRGYCVSCIGLNEKEIIAYVEYHEKENKGQLQLTL